MLNYNHELANKKMKGVSKQVQHDKAYLSLFT